MLLDPTTLHVEITSRCVLKCPRCPRTELKLDYLNQDIDPAVFRESFDDRALKSIKKYLFCGHTGDPIYSHSLLPVVEYIKTNSTSQITIVTNGSYQKKDFWQQLGSLLDHNDSITFSVDGWDQDSNTKYRVNSDFETICENIKTLKRHSSLHLTWSMIYFSFNQDRVNEIRNLARQLGCDAFSTVKSSKFDLQYATDGKDVLKPRDDLVASSSLYERRQEIFNDRSMTLIPPTSKMAHAWARCANHVKEPFLDVRGLVMPCAWSAGGYQDNDFIQAHREKLDIRTRSFMDILDDPVIWQDLLSRFELAPMSVCEMKCKNG